MEFSLSELFANLSGFLGIILVIILITQKKTKKTVQFSLAFFLLVVTLTLILGDLSYSGKIRHFPFLIRLDSPLHFLLGPAAYLYTLSSLKEEYKFTYFQFLNAIPFLLDALWFMPFYLESSEAKLNYYDTLMASGTVVMKNQYLLKTISVWVYLLTQYYVYFTYLKKLKQKGKKMNTLGKWFAIFLLIQTICYSGHLFDHLTGLRSFDDPYKFALVMMSILLSLTTVALLFFPQVVYANFSFEGNTMDKYNYSTLSAEKKASILYLLKSYIEGESKPYLDADISLTLVAQTLEVRSQQLSQVINELMNKSFNDYINALRIKYAQDLLLSDEFNKKTIEAIAKRAGFNSKSPFYSAFKKHSGVTPKQFVLDNLDNKD